MSLSEILWQHKGSIWRKYLFAVIKLWKPSSDNWTSKNTLEGVTQHSVTFVVGD